MFSLAEIEVAHDPHIFYPRPNVGQECLVIATMKMFPDFEADQLPCAPHRKRLLIRMPDSDPTLPEYILTRHDDAVSGPRVRSINAAFRAFHKSQPNCNTNTVREEARSDTDKYSFYHVGIWSKMSSNIFHTTDTRYQSEESRKALTNLMQKLQVHVIPAAEKMLRDLIPTHFQTTDMCVLIFSPSSVCD